MTIAVGDKLPDLKLKERTPDGPVDVSTGDLFNGRRVVLFAVPGAFTPTCSLNHLPGYLENRDAILAKGVDDIVRTAPAASCRWSARCAAARTTTPSGAAA